MTEEEKEEFYEKFLTELADDIRLEVQRDGGYWSIDKAIEGRLDMLRDDLKERL
jgi:hypothetical protein